jgi:ribosomal protein L24
MNKIRKGDEVIVLTGKDKGKRGTVLAVGADHVWSKVSTSPRSTSSRTR